MNTNLLIINAIIILGCAVLATACTSMKNTESTAMETHQKAEDAIKDVHSKVLNKQTKIVQSLDNAYLGSRSPIFLKEQPAKLPKQLHMSIELNFAEPLTFGLLGEIIARQTGLAVDIDPEIGNEQMEKLTWSGSIHDFLERVSTQQGVYWKWKDSKILLYRTELRIWSIYASGVSSKWSGNIALSGSLAGNGSDLSASDYVSVVSDDSNFWKETSEEIQNLLSPQGEATVSPNSGTLTVTDTPVALAKIDEWVKRKNQQLASQILVQVDLYEIEYNDSSDRGFSFKGILDSALSGGTLSTILTNNDDESLITFKYSRPPTDRDTEVSTILKASAGKNQISKLTSSVIRGLNGQPVPVFFGDETTYLQRRDVVNDENGSSVRLIPGKIQDGIALNLLSKVLPDTNQLILHATVRTTRIKSMKRFPADAGPNEPVIQLPDLESRSMLIPVLLKSGETLVVAGLDTSRSTGSRNNSLLAQNRRVDNKRARLILLITPRIIPPDIDIIRSRV